jgi:SAM-dependent methyltransferase
MIQLAPQSCTADGLEPSWAAYLDRWRRGEPRSWLFHDIVLDEVRRHGPDPTVLDIGCGRGIETDDQWQQSIARESGRYIGVEPDTTVPVRPCFSEVHRCRLEEAPVVCGTVQVALAAFVLEHVAEPEAFWRKLYDVLADGAVFWGLTVDRRHPFCAAARLAERLQIKRRYLRLVRRSRPIAVVDNYPTCYRANSPRQILPHVAAFRSAQFMNLHRADQLDSYVPPWLCGAAHAANRLAAACRLPGPVLLVRLQK